ncbi:MAG TPA: MCE family protein [Actinomycetota bacterium]|nr:MCE family protein [Actinomycetota bacterium]
MTRRTIINMITALVISGVLVWFGATRFLFPQEQGRTLVLETADASGVLPRSDVTIRGVPSGAVTAVHLKDDGTVRVRLVFDPGVTVPEGTTAEITRRSPIGDMTVDLTPGQGATLPSGAVIPMEDVTTPPDPVETIEALATTLGALTPEDVSVLTSELATALRGRGEDLATFAVAAADLQERILEVRVELESLIRKGPEVLDVLAQNADTLAEDLTLTAVLADVLRDRRFDLVELMRNGASFSEVFGELLASEKANVACLVEDLGTVNDVIARTKHLEDLKAVLELNHWFFGGADQTVQESTSDGYGWFRVHLQDATGRGQPYPRPRTPPDVFAGHGCHSRYGDGVGPGDQPTDVYLAPGSELHPGR